MAFTHCPDCGSERFTVQAVTTHTARVFEDGVLNYDSLPNWSEREGIACTACGRDFSVEDFRGVEHF